MMRKAYFVLALLLLLTTTGCVDLISKISFNSRILQTPTASDGGNERILGQSLSQKITASNDVEVFISDGGELALAIGGTNYLLNSPPLDETTEGAITQELDARFGKNMVGDMQKEGDSDEMAMARIFAAPLFLFVGEDEEGYSFAIKNPQLGEAAVFIGYKVSDDKNGQCRYINTFITITTEEKSIDFKSALDCDYKHGLGWKLPENLNDFSLSPDQKHVFYDDDIISINSNRKRSVVTNASQSGSLLSNFSFLDASISPDWTKIAVLYKETEEAETHYKVNIFSTSF
ncbi:MAG: hypothetical protein C0621_07655 [Desulfuromonas sp.]|nr:MAG: hypothetical protein C0621_07655 [Desulfuromonas sp.]